MNRAIVRCRCGHQVLSKEVLRTDLYERRSADSSAEYVCVRYRCRRCRRLGEAFVAETLWDWSALEADNSELSEAERDRFRENEPISENEMRAFHDELEKLALVADWNAESSQSTPDKTSDQTPDVKNVVSPLDASTRAEDGTPRDNPRPRGASPKPPEKPAPNATRGDSPHGENT